MKIDFHEDIMLFSSSVMDDLLNTQKEEFMLC